MIQSLFCLLVMVATWRIGRSVSPRPAISLSVAALLCLAVIECVAASYEVLYVMVVWHFVVSQLDLGEVANPATEEPGNGSGKPRRHRSGCAARPSSARHWLLRRRSFRLPKSPTPCCAWPSYPSLSCGRPSSRAAFPGCCRLTSCKSCCSGGWLASASPTCPFIRATPSRYRPGLMPWRLQVLNGNCRALFWGAHSYSLPLAASNGGSRGNTPPLRSSRSRWPCSCSPKPLSSDTTAGIS